MSSDKFENAFNSVQTKAEMHTDLFILRLRRGIQRSVTFIGIDFNRRYKDNYQERWKFDYFVLFRIIFIIQMIEIK